ncbi:MAG: nucleotide exchange factor GrpE [Firmicutes bacterium]|nr:nucleotide exchange factor GrpE [Candidatus Fiminaster equi]
MDKETKKENKAQEQIAKLTSDVEHWKNEYYRAYADMKNLREAVEKDHREAIKYRAAGFVENLLPILDGFHMALQCKATSQEMQNFLTGFEFIYRNMVSVLEAEGVTEISPKVGDQFDPNTMSAIETVYDEGKPNRVIKVNVCGYKLHDHLIRPSIVVVSTDKKDEPKSENKEESPKLDA